MLARTLSALLLAVLGAGLSGCCTLSRGFCPCPKCPPAGREIRRGTPNTALDFMTNAILTRRVADVYNSLHPEFRARFGGFSQSDFTTAFEYYEDDFTTDARRFARARREVLGMTADGSTVGIRIEDGEMSAVLYFRNQPMARIRLDDDFVPESNAVIPSLGEIIMIDGDNVAPLPVPFPGVTGADPWTVESLEYRNDWRLFDMKEARNIRFLDRLIEQTR